MNLDVPISSASKEIVVRIRVTGVKVFKIRTAIAIAVMRVASWIAPFSLEIES